MDTTTAMHMAMTILTRTIMGTATITPDKAGRLEC
jgi:hypothetical protein